VFITRHSTLSFVSSLLGQLDPHLGFVIFDLLAAHSDNDVDPDRPLHSKNASSDGRSSA
jgi:hypothetical protein